MVRGPRTAMKSGPHLPQVEKALAQKRRLNTVINKYIEEREFLKKKKYLKKKKKNIHPNVHCSTVYNSQVMEAI